MIKRNQKKSQAPKQSKSKNNESKSKSLKQTIREKRAALAELEKTTPASPRIPELQAEIRHLLAQDDGAFTETAREKMRADLARSKLDKRDEERMQLCALTSGEAKLAGFAERTGYLIPYFDLNGRRLPDEFDRVRYLDDDLPRYGQKKEIVCRIYYPPQFNWAKYLKPGAIVYLTEGEKKAAAACKLGIACAALGGVNNWQAKRKGFNVAVPDLIALFEKIKGGEIRIVFDSDLNDKPQVQAAMGSLAQAIIAAGITPHDVRLPSPTGDKVGLDDYLSAHSRKEFEALPLQSSEQFLKLRELNDTKVGFSYIKSLSAIWAFENAKLISSQDFKVRIANKKIVQFTSRGQEIKDLSELWLAWSERSEHHDLVFMPGIDLTSIQNGTGSPHLNTWKRSVTPRKPAQWEIDLYRRVRDHVLKPDEQWIPKFEEWVASTLQKPGTKQFTAILLRGVVQGSGKTALGNLVGSAFGSGYYHGEPDDLTRPFNSVFKNKEFVHIDEVISSHRRQDADRLKSIITKRTLTINEKFVPEYTVENFISFFFTSNHVDPLYAENADRRLFVLRAQEKKLEHAIGDVSVKKLDTWLNKKDQHGHTQCESAMLYYFLHNVDCSNFNPRAAAPATEGLEDLQYHSKSSVELWISELFNFDADNPIRDAIKLKIVTARDLFDVYPDKLKTNEVAFGRALATLRGRYAIKCNHRRFYALGHHEIWAQAKPFDVLTYYDATKRSGEAVQAWRNDHPLLSRKLAQTEARKDVS